MSTVNIRLSNSDVAMLKVPVMLATVELELVYTSIRVYIQWNPTPSKAMHLVATTHQPVFGDMNVAVAYRSISKDMKAASTQPYICLVVLTVPFSFPM